VHIGLSLASHSHKPYLSQLYLSVGLTLISNTLVGEFKEKGFWENFVRSYNVELVLRIIS